MQTERTILTLLEEADLLHMKEMAREPDTFLYLRKFQVMTESEYTLFLLAKLEQIRNKTGYHWAVRLKANQEFIGAANLNPIGDSPLLQIGCQLKRNYWRQGFASELTKRILEFAIDDLGIKSVYGVFEKQNKASRRLLEKLGFVWEENRAFLDVELELHKYTAAGDRSVPLTTLDQ
jgi:ribosomal-protein-alanine N-acetyltransferase